MLFLLCATLLHCFDYRSVLCNVVKKERFLLKIMSNVLPVAWREIDHDCGTLTLIVDLQNIWRFTGEHLINGQAVIRSGGRLYAAVRNAAFSDDRYVYVSRRWDRSRSLGFRYDTPLIVVITNLHDMIQ